jgi:hypothetical protein
MDGDGDTMTDSATPSMAVTVGASVKLAYLPSWYVVTET